METYTTTEGVECVIWTDNEGAMHSMTKDAYDELEAAKAEVKADEAKTK